MKNYIRDDGKMRLCSSNIAKMNIFEWMWYSDRLKSTLIYSLEQLKEGLILLGSGIINIASIIAFPVIYPVVAYFEIRRAKKEVQDLSGLESEV